MDNTATPVNSEILQRITEEDVALWMKARLQQLRQESLPGLSTMSLNVIKLDGYKDYTTWTLHACGECVTSEPTTQQACERLRRKLLLDDPAAQASVKRRQAEKLLDEAEELAKLASL